MQDLSIMFYLAFLIFFRDLLDLVGQSMREYETVNEEKQSCSYEVIHFFKKLFFNPGLYLESSPTNESKLLQKTEELELADSLSAPPVKPKIPMINNLPIDRD